MIRNIKVIKNDLRGREGRREGLREREKKGRDTPPRHQRNYQNCTSIQGTPFHHPSLH
jgi:hypothetical protein